MRKITILVISAILCAAASGCGAENIKDDDTVIEISGRSVVKAEYQMLLEKYDAGIKGRYTTEEANREDFWTEELEGGRPLDQIMELAEEELIHKKVVAKLASDAGIQVQTDYAAIAEQAEARQEKNDAETPGGNTEYGLAGYSCADLYSYVYTDAESRLVESLKQTYEVTEDELEQIYRENIEQYTSEVSVQMLVAETQDEVEARQAKRAAEDMTGEITAEELAEKYPDIRFYELTMSSLNMEEGKTGVYMQRWLIASGMQEGQVCEPFPVEERWLVMRCLKREEQTAEPFGNVKGTLENEVRAEYARKEIEKNIEKAEVEVKVREKVLEQIALEVLQQ